MGDVLARTNDRGKFRKRIGFCGLAYHVTRTASRGIGVHGTPCPGCWMADWFPNANLPSAESFEEVVEGDGGEAGGSVADAVGDDEDAVVDEAAAGVDDVGDVAAAFV